jgi:hypothetical protein
MAHTLFVVTVILAAFAMTPAVGHALELPGKMRLNKDEYRAVQRIYYPGFTIAGNVEVLSLVSVFVLLAVLPAWSPSFWLIIVALSSLIGMQIVYWVAIHPINKVWLEGQPLSHGAAAFFAAGRQMKTNGHAPEWTDSRNRWESAHLVRAVLAIVSFVSLVIAHGWFYNY